jgi:hypothetical protein
LGIGDHGHYFRREAVNAELIGHSNHHGNASGYFGYPLGVLGTVRMLQLALDGNVLVAGLRS